MKIPDFLRDAIVPMFTPFKEDQSVDTEGIRHLTEWLTAKPLSALFPLGGTGEWARLTFEERKRVIETVVGAAKGKTPVMPGVHGDSLAETLELVRFAEGEGADAVTVVIPPFIAANGEAVYRYYEAVADATRLPMVLYEPRKMGARSITPKLLGKLSWIGNIVGIKDSTSDLEKLMQHVAESEGRVAVLQGVETLYLPGLSVGAVGTVGGGCNIFPEFIAPIREAFDSGDHARALEQQRRVYRLWNSVAQGWPASGKRALRAFGVNIGETCRVKHGEIDGEMLDRLKSEMD